MAKFLVTLKRTVKMYHTVEIEADMQEDAEFKAVDNSFNGNYEGAWDEKYNTADMDWDDEMVVSEPILEA